MSIETEINRISTNVSDTLSAVSEMGGEVPEGATSDDMASGVRSIPVGAKIDDTTPSTTTTYSSSKIESEISTLNEANATQNTEIAKKANDADLAAVAKSGSYNDLTGKPTIPTVPTTLPNPNKLKLTGAVTAEYDGSSEVSVEIPAGGGATLLYEMTLEEDVLQVDIPIDSYIYNEFYAASKIGIRIELAFPAETDSTDYGALYVKYWCVAPNGATWAAAILLDGTKIVPTNAISWQKSTQANITIHKTTPSQGYSVSTVAISQTAFAYQCHQDGLVGTNIKYLRINTTEPNMLGAGSVIRIYTWG